MHLLEDLLFELGWLVLIEREEMNGVSGKIVIRNAKRLPGYFK